MFVITVSIETKMNVSKARVLEESCPNRDEKLNACFAEFHMEISKFLGTELYRDENVSKDTPLG